MVNPFADPRKYRSMQEQNLSKEELFYLLIEESKRTFKVGLIVTATVIRVLNSIALCRLDNGLTAIATSSDFVSDGSREKLQEKLSKGKIIQGRIERIHTEQEEKFEVHLNCKKYVLSSHAYYKRSLAYSLGIDETEILEADLKNHNFSEEDPSKKTSRFVPRAIAFEKFKNISSRRAISELLLRENGDYFFRPSTRSQDVITLTWKFWKDQIVHIDIAERDKPEGATIGSTLIISNDYYFESLREIVERYIIPCNRLVREVIGH